MSARGPVHLFLAWMLHDIEEALAFPETCNLLADKTGMEALRLNRRQSWSAVALMGIIVGIACNRGRVSGGQSRMYRAVTAGLHAHVGTHIFASLAQRRYTAGVVTALPVMLPGAVSAIRELRALGEPLRAKDYVLGSALLLLAAVASQVLARAVFRGKSR